MILGLPVVGNPRAGQLEHVRGQFGHTNPRQDQKALIADHLSDGGDAGLIRPPDPLIPRRQLQRGRTKTDATETALKTRDNPGLNQPARCQPCG